MSKMSDLHIELVEMVESGVSYEFIEDFMVGHGFPKERCRITIDAIARDIDELERIREIAAEASYAY
jgi:hypothetical protein